MSEEDVRAIPSSRFSTDVYESSLRFEAWRHFLSLYTVLPHPDGMDADFAGRIDTYVLGAVGIGTTAFSSQRYVRSRQRIAADGQDHIILQLLTAGRLSGTTASGREFNVRSGDLWVHDLGRAKTVTTEACSTVSVLLPRRDLLRMVGAGELDGCVLRRASPAGILLAQHLRTLARIAKQLPGDQAPAMAMGTIALVAACLRPEARMSEAARGPVASIIAEQLRDHIESRLFSPDLNVDALCSAFRISRAHLYRLFAPVGGVAGYIRQRRLECAKRQLRDPANIRRTIADIAFECGFTSDAHFSRAFRMAFGVAPSELRGAGMGPKLDDHILRHWEAVLPRL